VIRAARAGQVGDLVVATSTNQEDDPIASLAHQLDVACVRGSEDDVLDRFLTVLERYPSEAVMRLTGDCPLLDPVIIRAAAAAYSAAEVDYLSTITPRTLPRGLDVEVASSEVLAELGSRARGFDRAHVTSAIYRVPGSYRVAGLTFSPPAPDLRVTLDTPEDGHLLDEVVQRIGDRPPRWYEVVSILRANPQLVAINAHIAQKRIEEG
jgi:spore coat polysaccharide biosynthesis protein SpsF